EPFESFVLLRLLIFFLSFSRHVSLPVQPAKYRASPGAKRRHSFQDFACIRPQMRLHSRLPEQALKRGRRWRAIRGIYSKTKTQAKIPARTNSRKCSRRL